MTTFPSIIPDHPASKEVRVRETLSPLGDGLEYVTRFGLNVFDVLWKLRWDYLTFAERDTIETFLAARAADGEPFEWTPPDAEAPQQFRVDEWQPAQERPLSCRMELTFRRVWEVAGGVIESITCAEDAEISDLPPDPLPPGTYEIPIEDALYRFYSAIGANDIRACAINSGASGAGATSLLATVDNTAETYSRLILKVGAPVGFYCGRPPAADFSIYQTVLQGVRISDDALVTLYQDSLFTAWPDFSGLAAYVLQIPYREYALKIPATGGTTGPYTSPHVVDFDLALCGGAGNPGPGVLTYPSAGWVATLP